MYLTHCLCGRKPFNFIFLMLTCLMVTCLGSQSSNSVRLYDGNKCKRSSSSKERTVFVHNKVTPFLLTPNPTPGCNKYISYKCKSGVTEVLFHLIAYFWSTSPHGIRKGSTFSHCEKKNKYECSIKEHLLEL